MRPGPASTRHLPARIFASSRGRRRYRRATDVFLLVPSLLGLGVLIVVFPPSAFERSLVRMLASLPDWLEPVWAILYDSLALLAVALVLLAVVGRRPAVLLQALASVVLAAVVTVASARLAAGRWPDLDDLVRLHVDASTFPVLRVALAATVVLAVVPHLVRPLQRLIRWMLVLGLLGAILVEAAAPSGTVAALLVSVIAATIVRLASGTSAGHPETDDVIATLHELGIEVVRLEPADRQPAGVFVARGVDARGEPLLVKVYGRDAYDTQLLETAWRTAFYADDGPRLRRSRIEAVEHEALVTLLAQRAGVPTREVLVAAESSSGDAVLVAHDPSRPVTAHAGGETIDDALLAGAWRAIDVLGGAGIAHHRIEPDALAVFGGELGLVDFERATIAARPEHVLVDRAQLHATLAAARGRRPGDRRTRPRGRAGRDRCTPSLSPAGRFRARARPGAAMRRRSTWTTCGTGRPRRPSSRRRRSSGSAASPGAACYRSRSWRSPSRRSSAVSAASTTTTSRLPSATPRGDGSLAGFLLAQTPRLTQAMSTLGSVPARIPFLPVYAMQLATGYLNLALPSNLARMAINIRFFQRHGVPPATAVTAGMIDSFVSTVMQAILLAALLLFSDVEPRSRPRHALRAADPRAPRRRRDRGRARRRRRARASAPPRDRRPRPPLVAGRHARRSRASARATSSACCSAAASRPSCSSPSRSGSSRTRSATTSRSPTCCSSTSRSRSSRRSSRFPAGSA